MSSGTGKLYTVEVLALATSLAEWPLDETMPLRGEARSATCGSTIAMSLATDSEGRIQRLGMAPLACAIGQASATIFARSAVGKSRVEIDEALTALADWLAGNGPMPDWPGIDALAPARAYPARHGAILLAWRAVLDALPLTAPAS